MNLGNMKWEKGEDSTIVVFEKERCFNHNKGNENIPLYMVYMYPTSHESQANASLQGIFAQNVQDHGPKFTTLLGIEHRIMADCKTLSLLGVIFDQIPMSPIVDPE